MSSTRASHRLISPAAAVLVAACLALTGGCGLVPADDDRVPGSDSRALEGSAGSTSTVTSPPESPPEPIAAEENPACAPGDGKEVEDLPDLEIPAVSVEDFSAPEQRLGDAVIPGVRVPGFALPAITVDGGCIIRYEAPGACFGAVEIVDAELPGARIPGATLPPVVVDGESCSPASRPKGTPRQATAWPASGWSSSARSSRPTAPTTFVPSVFRESVFRESMFRASMFRESLFRPRICLEVDGSQECTPSVSVPSASVPSVSMASASVESASMPSRTLEGTDTTVREDETQQAYVTPAEVLFEFDKSDIKPDAMPTLQAIAAEIAKAPAGSKITVEGHTDSKGTDAYNQSLSEDRAASVATWLQTSGGIDASILSTRGYGESAPAAPNDTAEGQAENRRVVITLRLP